METLKSGISLKKLVPDQVVWQLAPCERVGSTEKSSG
jgi:hypothetical protein